MKNLPLLTLIFLLALSRADAQLLLSGTPARAVALTDASTAYGLQYTLQRSPDLANWTNLGAALDGTATPLSWTDSTGLSRAFYRLIQSPINTYPLYGIGFSPYLDGQSSLSGTNLSLSQIQSRMQILAPYCGWIRNFGMTNGLQVSGSVAHQLGLKVALTAWLGPETSGSGLSANQTNIANLITAGTTGQADILVVGSEVLTRGDLSITTLINYINQVKAALPSGLIIPVTTADTYGEYILPANSALLSTCDVLFVNFYPFWQPIDFADAMPALNVQYLNMLSLAGGKTVWAAETGWPSGGSTYQGVAVPSQANAASYFQTFISWARYHSVPYFYFEGFNEAWKSAVEGDNGPYWGLWTSTGSMQQWGPALLANQYYPSNWNPLINGAGTPSISFTSVPPLSDQTTATVSGSVSHAAPLDCYVALYIYVDGNWWEKPYANQPFTAVSTSGTWSTLFATGGSDHQATQLAAYLFPFSYIAPNVGNTPSLPPALNANALKYAFYTRQ